MQRRQGAGGICCLAVVGLLAMACYAYGQAASGSAASDPPGDAKQVEPKKADVKEVQVKRATKSRQPAADAGGGCGSSSAQPKPTDRSAAKKEVARAKNVVSRASTSKGPEVAKGPPWPGWACEESNLTLEDLWAGQTLSATWTIRNDGEGDLEILAKGG
jgi:hypothetical protein